MNERRSTRPRIATAASRAATAYRAHRQGLEPVSRLVADPLAFAAPARCRVSAASATTPPGRCLLMSVFSDQELAYLAEPRLGRLATIGPDGLPHIVPLGWGYNPALDSIDIGGRDFARTKKLRNVQANPKAALVIDDVLPPWRPRAVMIRGRAAVSLIRVCA